MLFCVFAFDKTCLSLCSVQATPKGLLLTGPHFYTGLNSSLILACLPLVMKICTQRLERYVQTQVDTEVSWAEMILS